ncbi:MAG: BolA/IbaG family iron-sulfur metabolism protein [Francisella sp.]
MNSISLAESIKNKILFKIDPQAKVEITDDTYKHIKHKGYIEGKYHFTLNITSSKLSCITKVKAHKLIFKAIEDIMPHIHALSIKIKQE